MTAVIPDLSVPFLPRGVRLHHCQVRGGWFLLAPERAVKLDGSGVHILQALDGERSFAALVEHLAGRFRAPSVQIADDARVFLEDLLRRRMLELRQ